MLRINLLPVRQLKKRAKAQKELFAMGLLFLGTLLLLFFVAMWQLYTISSLEEEKVRLTAEKKELEPQIAFMDALKASDFVSEVALANSSLKVISGRNLKSFVLNAKVFYPEKYKKKSMQTEDSLLPGAPQVSDSRAEQPASPKKP